MRVVMEADIIPLVKARVTLNQESEVASPLRIYIGSDNLVVCSSVQDKQTGDNIIAASTFSCALYNTPSMLSGSLVTSSNVNFTYSSDQGRWEAVIPATVTLAEDASYWLKVTIATAGGLDAVLRREVVATYAEGE